MWQKVRSIWKYVHEHYAKSFDWFIIGGEDMFVIPSNLRAYLTSDEVMRASQHGLAPAYLGKRQVDIIGKNRGQLFNEGGAGYTMNRAALSLLVAHLDNHTVCQVNEHTSEEVRTG